MMGQNKVLRTAEWRRQQIREEFEQRVRKDIEDKKKQEEEKE